MAAQFIPLYTEIFNEGYWEVLTTPGSLAYDPLWSPILISEIAVNTGLIIALLYMIFLFFSKKRLFPKYYIGILLFTLVFMVADMLALKVVLPNEPMFDPETTKEFIRSIIGALIWIPYMLVSKRVKATFIQ